MVPALHPERAERSVSVTIRADASAAIGTGHVVRMLALAGELVRRDARVAFVARTMPDHLRSAIRDAGIAFAALRDDADDATATRAALGDRRGLLVVDHYGIGAEWEAALRPHCAAIVAIDDLADRRHACDVLVDQNHHPDPAARYAGLVPAGTTLLLGPQFALLRPQFARERTRALGRDARSPMRIFVCFGGSDPSNETTKALAGIAASRYRGVPVDVVVGGASPHRATIEAFDALAHLRVFAGVTEIAPLMAEATLAIGAGGTMTWERCALGLPSMLAVLAENQDALTASLAREGTVVSVGPASATTPQTYREALDALDDAGLDRMRRRSAELVDGRGATRVAERILAAAAAEA
jgi:UDP-2,4-diacetamido-2,4,6-trideoxy-beta-L-altropyranose hydrolase